MSDLSRRTFLASTAGMLATTACSVPSSKRVATASSSFDRERFVEDVKRALPQGQGAVDQVIARAVSRPESVIRALGAPDKAAIAVLHRDESLSIFNIVWPPMAMLVPHDHLMWASIGVYSGREDNIMWRRTGATIEATTAASVAEREVFSLPPDAIHSVVNPVERYTAGLHVYGGDLSGTTRSQWDALTLREEPFDIEEGRRILTEADRRFGGRGS